MIKDLQEGDVVMAEKMDRLTRLPLEEAEKLIQKIKEKGALLAIPGIVDLSDFVQGAQGVLKIVLNSVQELLLKLALQMARDDFEDRRERQRQGIALAKEKGKYQGRKANLAQHQLIIKLRPYYTLQETATLAKCHISQVKRVLAAHRKNCSPKGEFFGQKIEDGAQEGI